MAQMCSPPASRSSRLSLRAAALLIGAAWIGGCNKPDEIQKYTVQRVEQQEFVPPEFGALPPGWAPLGQFRSKFSKYVEKYKVGDDGELSVTVPGGRIPLLDDINRWRGVDHKLDPVDALPKDIRKLRVLNTDCDYVDIVGPVKRTLVVILPRQRDVWYFKLLGPKELVARHQRAFEEFVQSVTFPDEL